QESLRFSMNRGKKTQHFKSPWPVSRHPSSGTIPVPRAPSAPSPHPGAQPAHTLPTIGMAPGIRQRSRLSARGIPHTRKMPAAEGRRICPSTGRLRPGPAHGARRGEHPLITSSLLLFYPPRSAEPKARRCTGQEKAPSEGGLRFPIKAL
uniref:Uncharacterized protein n=1 Tax=Geospiza parvula TaxID=87175 RepID=A0A8U8BBM6_GEOPR